MLPEMGYPYKEPDCLYFGENMEELETFEYKRDGMI